VITSLEFINKLEPEIRRPLVIAAMQDMGNVGSIVVNFINKSLHTTPFRHVKSTRPPYVYDRGGFIEIPEEKWEYRFGNDFIIFGGGPGQPEQNDELNELKTALSKSIQLLNKEGRLIVVSFQSLEDRIVKDFFNHNSGKRWRSSRHYPELVDEGPITFNIITKKPIRPSEREILNNPRSRSAKLRVGEKIN